MSDTRDKYYVDLFAGCGGLSSGLLKAGWKGIFAIEKSIDAFETLQFNLIDNNKHFDWPTWFPIEPHDINDILSSYYNDLINLRGNVDLVAGGPPCQGFSTAGRRKMNDSRNRLIDSYISFVNIVRPKIIFFENVRGFTISFKDNSKRGKIYSEYVLGALSNAGYNVRGKLIDFSLYGVPQKRTRFILVGIRKDIDVCNTMARSFFQNIEDNKNAFLKSKSISVPVSLEEAISDLLEVHGTVVSPDDQNFKSGKYSKTLSRYQKLMRKGKRKGATPDSHRFVNHSETIRDRFKFAIEHDLTAKEFQTIFNLNKVGTKKLNGNVPTSTLTTLPDDYIHYCEPRTLTVREYARIQSFPDSYEFKGRYTTGGRNRTKDVPRYTQVGNAIPPLFAEQCGFILKEMI